MVGIMSLSGMPRADTGNGVSVVRSNDKVTPAAWEGNALRQARCCLSALGVTRSMHSSGVIVAGIFWLSVVLWALPAARLPMGTYHMFYVWHILLDGRLHLQRRAREVKCEMCMCMHILLCMHMHISH